MQTREKLAGVDPESGGILWSHEIPAFRGMNILTPTVDGDSIFTSAYGGKSFPLPCSDKKNSFHLKESWTNKVTGYMSSPLVVDHHLYVHLQNQRFTCLEIATGKSKWTTTPFGKYWSMLAHKDRILALDETGELFLIQQIPKNLTD